MKVRILTSIGIGIVGIPILIFSKYIVFPIALSLFALFAVYEMLRVLGAEKKYFISVPVYLMALAFPIGAFFARDDKVIPYLMCLAGVLFGYLLYLFFFAVFMRGSVKYTQISEIFSSVTYIVASFTALSVIRYMPNGVWNLSLVFLAAWGTDIFAYFVGTFIGKHKLIPEISPKKTVEGSVGAIILDIGAFILFGFIVSLATDVSANYLILALSGLLLSVISQLGDLIASLIKREHGVKDYGNILPGHGGIMDRFDSVLAVPTVLMMICILFPPFV